MKRAVQKVWDSKDFQVQVEEEKKHTGQTYEQIWDLLEGVKYNPFFYTLAIEDILQGCSYNIVKDLYCSIYVRIH